ncbi:hypothetical protein COV61_04735 [Candidatus Micrarchaeota archaeon CG11_big_fil_rev_8_21_14_0_20_47_5]|nr:MAG: hypothetical protein AUJ17_00195 [Candidatus Micrarchaeota archaeon CG1_02_47_40]PIN82870.1 MAG: hypothetical protein COV61_04735 [Candidatus Micrarchaeota archaeon CG11_big_fil_rev_8_21_14_0_20_47_5]
MFANLQETAYYKRINDYFLRDFERFEDTARFAKFSPSPAHSLYTSFSLPIKINFPLFEPRVPYATAENYFQPMLIDGEKQPIKFAQDCTRSISLYEGNLVVISKFVSRREGKEYFQSYCLLKFSPTEFSLTKDENSLQIKANCRKKVKNILTEEEEEKEFSFTFNHKDISHSIIQKKMGVSTKVREVYAERNTNLLSGDLENYLISVPHLNPHPYLLDCHAELGFASRRDFQINGWKYFL